MALHTILRTGLNGTAQAPVPSGTKPSAQRPQRQFVATNAALASLNEKCRQASSVVTGTFKYAAAAASKSPLSELVRTARANRSDFVMSLVCSLSMSD